MEAARFSARSGDETKNAAGLVASGVQSQSNPARQHNATRRVNRPTRAPIHLRRDSEHTASREPHPPDLSAYRDDPDAYEMPGGPYKGWRLDELPTDFLQVVAQKNWFAEVREFAQRVLAERTGSREGPIASLVVTRGRHEGKKLVECPPDYLLWLSRNSKSAISPRGCTWNCLA